MFFGFYSELFEMQCNVLYVCYGNCVPIKRINEPQMLHAIQALSWWNVAKFMTVVLESLEKATAKE